MIKELIERLVATWPNEIEALAWAVQMALPWVLLFGGLWYTARGGQWLIDRYTVPKRPGSTMRTASARQMEREVEQLWRRFPDTIQPAPTALPRVRDGKRKATPFAEPANDRRRRAP
jgi:hypothetical protein